MELFAAELREPHPHIQYPHVRSMRIEAYGYVYDFDARAFASSFPSLRELEGGMGRLRGLGLDRRRKRPERQLGCSRSRRGVCTGVRRAATICMAASSAFVLWLSRAS